MSALALREVALEEMTVEDLLARVSAGHVLVGTAQQAALRGMRTALDHAIRVGGALNELKRRFDTEPRRWRTWAAEHIDLEESYRSTYMRIAAHADLIPDGITTISDARRHLLGLPPVDNPSRHRLKVDDGQRATIKEMRRRGASWSEVSRLVGVSRNTARAAIDPKFVRHRQEVVRASHAKRAAERAALQAAEADRDRRRLVRDADPDISKQYALVRRALDQGARAIEGVKPSVRQALREAEAALTKAEAALLTAMQLERQEHSA
jgi:hypothetical protein